MIKLFAVSMMTTTVFIHFDKLKQIRFHPNGDFTMAVNAFTSKAAALLADIKKQIDGKHIISWSYDGDGDFTHTPTQFVHQAWFRPEIKTDRLRFRIIGQKDQPLTRGLYAIYHGRFIEMLIEHEASFLTSVSATPQPDQDEPSVKEK